MCGQAPPLCPGLVLRCCTAWYQGAASSCLGVLPGAEGTKRREQGNQQFSLLPGNVFLHQHTSLHTQHLNTQKNKHMTKRRADPGWGWWVLAPVVAGVVAAATVVAPICSWLSRRCIPGACVLARKFEPVPTNSSVDKGVRVWPHHPAVPPSVQIPEAGNTPEAYFPLCSCEICCFPAQKIFALHL